MNPLTPPVAPVLVRAVRDNNKVLTVPSHDPVPNQHRRELLGTKQAPPTPGKPQALGSPVRQGWMLRVQTAQMSQPSRRSARIPDRTGSYNSCHQVTEASGKRTLHAGHLADWEGGEWTEGRLVLGDGKTG